ncbi:SpoIIIAH-like family protein [Bacillus massiliigorillae]|uniref:SpoIIIAH-like family protein n=1 Tax=Bacillus massiliigorillae TaxID=1243664 RepID=UPI0003A93ED7|nr:SpoIIIAH-like family protein [Bacillus massiliigorillae]
MLLKKQTVWLLTMLSLVVVLSVYYVTTPSEKETNMATTVEKEKSKESTKETTSNKNENPSVATDDTSESKDSTKDTIKEVVPIEGDETFQTLRMEITDERNKTIEDLTAMVGNTELSAEERDKANETIKELRGLTEREVMLEKLITSLNYDAVLVRAQDNNVRVTVKANKLSNSAANDIVRIVTGEMPTAQDVSVEFQPKQ